MEQKTNLTANQQERINNLNNLQMGISLAGLIAGLIYANKTGGKFWRYIGYSFVGSVATGLTASIVLTPFKNKILKEGETGSTKQNTNMATQKDAQDVLNVLQKSDSTPYTLKQINDFIDLYTKNIDKNLHSRILVVVNKKESDWTPQDKLDINVLREKVVTPIKTK